MWHVIVRRGKQWESFAVGPWWRAQLFRLSILVTHGAWNTTAWYQE